MNMNDDARDSFKEFVLEWTGRSLEQHHTAGTTGLEFAWACWLRGGRLTDEEREAIAEAMRQVVESDCIATPHTLEVIDTLRGLLRRRFVSERT
jgi:hypothetical protein